MQCVIFAGGQGTRMRPLTLDRPKPLVAVAGRPIIDHILGVLPSDIDSLVVVVKYRGDQMRAHLGATFRGMPIGYAEQGVPDGTGGALVAAQPFLHGRFMVMNADDLHGAEALALLAGEPLAVLGAISSEPERYGVLTVSPDYTLLDIEEKPEQPKSNLVTTGTMVLDQRIFQYQSSLVNNELRLTDMVTALAQDAPVRIVSQSAWCPVGRPEDIPVAEEFLRLM